jgi:hypothetical protein
MSAALDSLLDAERLAQCREADALDAARDAGLLTPAQREMQNTLIRAAFVASQRRFDSQFGELA